MVRILKILNIVLVSAVFSAGWFLYYVRQVSVTFTTVSGWLLPALFLVLYVLFARIYEGFSVSLYRISEIVGSQLLATALADAILCLVIGILMQRFPNLPVLLLLFVIQSVVIAAWSTLVHQWYFKTFPPKRSAIVYDSRAGMEELIGEYGLEKKFQILWTAPVEECLRDHHMLDGLEVVFLSDLHIRERNVILKYCILKGISVYTIPRIGDVIMSGAKRTHLFHLPILSIGRYCATPEQALLKRAFDIVVSAAALVCLSPILLLTALAIKLCDGGPVFYKQNRLTLNGKVFQILKFRSMRTDAEKDGVARLSMGERDTRVTAVGRVIRKVRIDELPQLLNVLKGDMAIVGPRPERPEIAAQYEKKLPEFRLRLQVKAGLTGYAQVYGKYNTTPYDKLQMDLMYIANPGILNDLSICIATVKVLFLPESTEGFQTEQPAHIPEQTDRETVGML